MFKCSLPLYFYYVTTSLISLITMYSNNFIFTPLSKNLSTVLKIMIFIKKKLQVFLTCCMRVEYLDTREADFRLPMRNQMKSDCLSYPTFAECHTLYHTKIVKHVSCYSRSKHETYISLSLLTH